MSSPGTLAFGLSIGYFHESAGGATLPPDLEKITVDGETFAITEGGIDILAGGFHRDQAWQFMAESGDIVGNAAKRSLFLQILSAFQFSTGG